MAYDRQRGIRVPDDLWEGVLHWSRRHGMSASAVVRLAIGQLLRGGARLDGGRGGETPAKRAQQGEEE